MFHVKQRMIKEEEPDMASQRAAIAYELVTYPATMRLRVLSIGITDTHGRLWQFWATAHDDNINITEGSDENPDYRVPRGRDFAIDLRQRGIDSEAVTAPVLRRLALEWIKDRNDEIESGNITN
jgi:hypothetical protein